jgi:HlyD family secretion protein
LNEEGKVSQEFKPIKKRKYLLIPSSFFPLPSLKQYWDENMALNNESRLLRNSVSRRGIVLLVAIGFGSGLLWLLNSKQSIPFAQTKLQNPPKTSPARIAVTALGRLVPEGEVTRLSAPHSINGVRVERLLVKEGDQVKAGQVMAYLEDYNRATSAYQQAKDKLQIAEAQLAQVKSGARSGDIEAQKAAVSRLQSQLKSQIASSQADVSRIQAQLENAETENGRYQKLFREGAVSAAVADSKRLQADTIRKQLDAAKASLKGITSTVNDQQREAKARLESISEVRDVDVKLAKSQVQSAMTAITQAKADLELTYIKSPISGEVLKIFAKNGEVIATSGFAEIGKTSQMSVLAEVYQTDVQKVRKGQKATIRSTAFPGEIKGTVSEIGSQVDKQRIFTFNPAADTDRRVVEVKIRIDNPKDSQRLQSLTNLQVDVAIRI